MANSDTIYVIGRTCPKGKHLLTEKNLKWKTAGTGRVRYCSDCAAERRKELRAANPEKAKEQTAAKTLAQKKRRQAKRPVETNTAPERFGTAMETTQTKCNTWFKQHPGGLDPWTDYGDDEDSEHLPDPPTAQEARALCEGCPLLVLCGEAAIETPPYHGVRAGMVFNAGKRISRRRKKK